jgi:major outer membrane protein ompA
LKRAQNREHLPFSEGMLSLINKRRKEIGMNIRKLWLAVFALLFVGTFVSAQEQRIKEEGKMVFKPHWFIQMQAGGAHTVGEAKFTDLISPAAAINVGYQFAPAWRVRVGASGWQAKGRWVSPQQDYQYKYLQGSADIISDLSTLFCGFNPKRVFNGYAFVGIGLNHAFDNDEANALDTRGYQMEYLWKDSKNFVSGRLGLGCNLRLNDCLAINIEGNANILSDKFNSKKAGNADWQFNALVGLNIKFGKDYTKTKPVYYEAEPVVVEQPKPAPVVEQPKPKQEVVVAQPMKQDVFFALNSAKIQDDQKAKIDALVEYLQKNSSAKVKVTGYADVDTGNPRINKTLSEKRAANVADVLKAKGITTDRIIVDSKGDTVQPYKTPKENRVSICVAE